jgi:hypothetical protein
MRLCLFVLLAVSLSGFAPASTDEGNPATILTRLDDVPAAKQGIALLVFFSTECASCYEDLFEMRYLVEKNDWPVSVIGIAAGARVDLEVFLKKYAWPFPVVWDRRRAVFKRFGVRNAPFKVVIAGGEQVYADDGYKDPGRRRTEISKFFGELFSRFR